MFFPLASFFFFSFSPQGTLLYVHPYLSVHLIKPEDAGLSLQQANKQRPEGSAELCYCQAVSLQHCTLAPKGTFSSWCKIRCSSRPSLEYCSQSYFGHIHLCYKWSPKTRAYRYWPWAHGFFYCIKGASTLFCIIYFSSFWLYSANWSEGHGNRQKLRNRSQIITFCS